jgi:hypothetical protein
MVVSRVVQFNDGTFMVAHRHDNLNNAVAKTAKLIAVADESGSMQSSFADVRTALKALLTHQTPLTVVFFSNAARTFVFRSPDEIDRFRPMFDGTNFNPAVSEIARAVVDVENVHEVIFFTDGQGYFYNERIQPEERKRLASCRISVIGLSNSSDTAALLEVRKLGGEKGTFDFAKDSHQLVQKIDEALANSGSSGVTVQHRGKSLFLRFDGSETLVYEKRLETEDEKRAPLTIASFDDEIRVFADQLQKIAESPTKEALTHWQSTFDALMEARARKDMTPLQFGEIINMRTAANNILYAIQQSRSGRLSNHELATINAAAQHAMPRRFVRAVMDRSEKGADRIAQQDERLAKLKEEMATADLSDQPNDLQCVFTQMSVEEALREGDCLGIAVRGAGNENVIMNPYLFKVESVGPTFLTTGGFTNAAYYQVKQNPSLIKKFSSSSADVLMTGVAREDITGIIPLFLNETHWKVAKLLQDRMTAQLICKDPLQGTFAHRTAAVVLAMQWCEKNQQASEINRIILKLLEETLIAMVRDYPGFYVTPTQFMESVEKRLPMEIPDLQRQQYIWQKTCVHEVERYGLALKLAVWEEQQRRRLNAPGATVEVHLTTTPDVTKQVKPEDIGLSMAVHGLGYATINDFLREWVTSIHTEIEETSPVFRNAEEEFHLSPANYPVLKMDNDKLTSFVEAGKTEYNDPHFQWRIFAMVLQLTVVGSVCTTTEWASKRDDFLNKPLEDSVRFVRNYIVKHIQTRQAAQLALWSSSLYERRKQAIAHRLTNAKPEELKQSDFNGTFYIGKKGDVHSALFDWVSSPLHLRFVVNATRLDNDSHRAGKSLHVSKKMLARLIRYHKSFMTPELVADIWPVYREHVEKLVLHGNVFEDSA